MSLLDIPDVFFGSTDDGHTFAIVNRHIPDTGRLLTKAGFQAREHLGRTLYALPPDTSQAAHERAGIAVYGLLAHTLDLIDFAWTTRWSPEHPVGDPDLHFQFSAGTVSATAVPPAARFILEQHDFALAEDGSTYRPPGNLNERGLLSAVTAA